MDDLAFFIWLVMCVIFVIGVISMFIDTLNGR
jgi:hypothetical protein